MVKIHAVNAGVDTFVINAYFVGPDGKPVKREVETELADQLDEWKKQAQNSRELYPTDLMFRNASLLMCPNGAGRGQWQWMLRNDDIVLYISRGKWNGIAGVRFNSEFLWSRPFLADALADVHALLYDLFHEVLHLQPSSVDLCVDIAGWDDIERLDKKRHFVSHSRKRGRHSETEQGQGLKADDFSYGLRETGFDFSQRGPMSVTIYNKTREIQRSGKLWFPELWRLRDWNEEASPDVWRVEAKLGREVLRDVKQEGGFHGIEDAYQVEELLPLLWAYAVGHVEGGADGLPDGWLRCVVPSSDTNRARWPAHPAWRVVQGAFQQGLEVPEHFGKIIRKAKEDHNIEKGIGATLGYLSSLSAWVGGPLAEPGADLSVSLHWLMENGADYLEKRDRDFSLDVQRKRVKIGKQPVVPSSEIESA